MITVTELAKHWGVGHQYVGRCVKRGCPLDSFEMADLWRQANQKRVPSKKVESREDTIKRLAKSLDLEKEVSTVADAELVVEIARENVVETRLLLRQAFIEKKPSAISTYLNLNAKATENWYKAEAVLLNKKKEAGIVLTLQEAMAKFRKPIEQLVQRITAFPQNVAARVNPHDPGHAMDILQQECISMIKDARDSVGSNGSRETI
jgi:hypothetical protein